MPRKEVNMYDEYFCVRATAFCYYLIPKVAKAEYQHQIARPRDGGVYEVGGVNVLAGDGWSGFPRSRGERNS